MCCDVAGRYAYITVMVSETLMALKIEISRIVSELVYNFAPGTCLRRRHAVVSLREYRAKFQELACVQKLKLR